MYKSMSVQVRQTPVRSTPSFMGHISAVLSHGDQVSVTSQDQGWMQIEAGVGQGFVHESALTPKTIILNPGSKEVEQAASSDEYALAGKGFNTQVEGQFRSRNPQLNFSAVDQMEAYGVSENAIRAFLIQGRVFPEKEAS